MQLKQNPRRVEKHANRCCATSWILDSGFWIPCDSTKLNRTRSGSGPVRSGGQVRCQVRSGIGLAQGAREKCMQRVQARTLKTAALQQPRHALPRPVAQAGAWGVVVSTAFASTYSSFADFFSVTLSRMRTIKFLAHSACASRAPFCGQPNPPLSPPSLTARGNRATLAPCLPDTNGSATRPTPFCRPGRVRRTTARAA